MNIYFFPFISFFFCLTSQITSNEYSEIKFHSGVRQGHLSWNFSSSSKKPYLESKLHIDSVHIFYIGASWKNLTIDNVYTRGAASIGKVLDGVFKETLREFTSNKNLFCSLQSYSEAKTNSFLEGRYVADLSVAIGYPYYLCNYSFQMTPIIGYSYYEQNLNAYPKKDLRVVKPSQLNKARSVAIRFYKCASNKLIQRWWGPWIGLDIDYRICQCWNICSELEYHFASFKGKRLTNLGFSLFDDFNYSFNKAHGIVFKCSAQYFLFQHYIIGITSSYQNWKASKNRIGCQHLSTKSKWFLWGLELNLGGLF